MNIETGLWICHACGRSGDLIQIERELTGADFKSALAEVCRIVGRETAAGGGGGRSHPSIVAEYGYTDEGGHLLYQTVRYDPKAFKQRRPGSNGEWLWNLNGVRLVLYRLPELIKRASETVFVCEGEKDVHAMEKLGLLATCNPMGAGTCGDD
jgi:putative DNA primase/helicase